MFKKALKTMKEYIVGCIVALIIVALILGVQAAIDAIIPVFVGICCAFIAALYFTTNKNSDEDK